MPTGKVDFSVVRQIATALEGVEESTSYGAPSFKLEGRMMACLATNKAAEPNSLVVRVGFEQRDEFIAEDPKVYYLKDHYRNYPSVLVRLSEIDRDSLQGVLLAGWHFVRREKRKRRRTRGR